MGEIWTNLVRAILTSVAKSCLGNDGAHGGATSTMVGGLAEVSLGYQDVCGKSTSNPPLLILV